MSTCRWTILAWVGLWSAAPPAGAAEAPTVEARLLADRTALVAGGGGADSQTLTLAVQFEVEDGWHIYWRNRGEGGLDTTLTWQVPPGFAIRSERWPTPKRHVDVAGSHTFILEGKPTVLAELAVPPDLKPGAGVKIGVEASWLVCRDRCYKGGESLSLTLPVVADRADAKPAHEAVFAAARRAVPVPAGEAKYLDGLSAVASVDRVAPRAEFEIAVVLDVAAGHHINAHEPLEASLIATDVFPEAPRGLQVDRVRFPEGMIERSGPAGERLSVYRGETVVIAPVRAEGDLAGKEIRLGGVVRYQACNDETRQCYRPMSALWSVTLPVAGAGETAKAQHAELFAKGPRTGDASSATSMATSGEPGASAGNTDTVGLPRWEGKGEHLDRITVTADVARVAPETAFELRVALEVEADHHINSHAPLERALIPTVLTVEEAAGLSFGEVRYPAGEFESGGLAGQQLSVYRGKVEITVPVEATAALPGPELTIRGAVRYQACNDKTHLCYAPTSTAWELTLPSAGAGDTAVATTGAGDAGVAAADDGGAGESADGGIGVGGVTSDSWLGRSTAWLAGWGIAGYLVMALIGGFLLNLMPCVLPVVSIKVLSFVQQAKESRWRVFTLGLTFALGIELSFVVLGVLIVLMGQQWGGLFQKPQVVIGLAAVVTVFALSLFGVFALFPPRVVNELGEKVQREGHLSALGMGLLATALGTACTAPFLTVVIAFATQQPAVVGLLVFVVAGLGMAMPYVVLAAKPVWLRFVPKPGPWMTTFEHVMGFVLLGTVIWLFNTLSGQIGGPGMLWALAYLLLAAMAGWCYGKVEHGAKPGRRLAYYGAAAVLIVGGWAFCFRYVTTIPDLIARHRAMLLGRDADWLAGPRWQGDEIPWVRYTRERGRRAVEAGWTVFIDYTADWCASCKANEKAFINTEPVREAMRRLRVMPFKADYTLEDPDIAADLNKYGSGGVPMYLVIPAHKPDEVIRLDEVPVPAAIVRGLEQAGPSTYPQAEAAARPAADAGGRT